MLLPANRQAVGWPRARHIAEELQSNYCTSTTVHYAHYEIMSARLISSKHLNLS